MTYIYESAEQLNDNIAYWQGVLRLQDWDISASIYRRDDMPGSDDNMGLNRICWEHKHSRISILSHIDLTGEIDQEQTAVHELLHLHVEPMFFVRTNDKDEQITFSAEILIPKEQMINRLASTLVELNRR